MLGSGASQVALPSRGPLARVKQTFSQKVEEEKIPEVESLRTAGSDFQMSRRFATVDENGNAETGRLTVSSGPLSKESYDVLEVDGV